MFDKYPINPINTSGNVEIITEGVKSEIDFAQWSNNNKPEVEFSKVFYLNDHDSRLYLSSDTYTQLILGSGMIITGQSATAVKKIKKWIKAKGLEEKIEDGVHSYVIAGNLLYELIKKGKRIVDIDEIDVTTIRYADRDKSGKIKKYTQYVNNKEIPIDSEFVAHLKFTNRRQELWGRSLFQSIISPKEIDGKLVDSAVEEMWKVEHAMVKIFQSYASPIMMIHFVDVGDDFIIDQQQKFSKIGPGAKIITDKEFKAEVFEVNPASKFDKYIEHLEKDVIQAGGQFASQIMTAGFTARASSESATDIIKLKIKRIQRRLGLQLKKTVFDPYLEGQGDDIEKADIQIDFQFDSESVLTVQDVVALFEKGTLRRSEVRKYIADNTDVEVDKEDMADTPPITSVTPTNSLHGDNTHSGNVQPKALPTPNETPSMLDRKTKKEFMDKIQTLESEIKLMKESRIKEINEQKEINLSNELQLIKEKKDDVIREKKMKILEKIDSGISGDVI